MASDKKKAKKLAYELLKRRAAGETPKSQLSSQLLDLIERFFDEIGYTKSYKALKTEREKYSDGTKDKLPNSSSLANFFHEWQTSNSTKIPVIENNKINQKKKDLKKGSKKAILNSEATCSSKSSSSKTYRGGNDDLSDVSTNDGSSSQNPINVKTVNTKKRKVSTSSSSSDSNSSSNSSAPKRKKIKMMARVDDVSKSSSGSSSNSDNITGTISSDSTTSSSDSEIIAEETDSSSSDTSSSNSDPQDTVGLPKTMALLDESDSSSDSDSSNSTSSDDSSSLSDASDSSDSSDASDSSDSSDSSCSVLEKGGKNGLTSTPKKSSKKDIKDKAALKNSTTIRVKSKETPMKAEAPTKSAVNSVKSEKKSKEPFSRIPKDIKVDKKLASNAYVPYDYAQKAHEDLIVTKGKGFTKEKNKKKRGSYRGGHIDVDGKNGIKFDD